MTIDYCGVKLLVDFSYEAPEKETYDHPGSPDSACIESILVENTDIYDLLTAEQLYEIEEMICQKMRDE